jgi:hypothetical protein
MATIFNAITGSIAGQIDVRQRIMAGNVTDQHARNTYLNKACVVKLVPLVKDTSSPQSAITYDDFIFDNFTLKNNFFNNPTGFGYNDKVEKPFIQNIEITSRSGNNYGATRTGKLTLIIPTKNQFNLIERYFRIGTAFLLEWGWSKYVVYEGNKVNSESTLFVDSSTYNGDVVDDVSLENAILQKRESNKGNYDGGIFYITNFTTNIQNNTTDYYYELTLSLVSKGDILNSLKPSIAPVSGSGDNDISDKIKKNPIINVLEHLENEETNLFPETNDNQNFKKFTEEYPNNKNHIKIAKKTQTEYRGRAAGGTVVVEKVTTTISESKSYVKLRYILKLLGIFTEENSIFIEGDQQYIVPEYSNTIPLKTAEDPTRVGNRFETRTSIETPEWEWDSNIHFASFNPTRIILPHYVFYSDTNNSIKEFLQNEPYQIGSILIRTKFLIDELSNLIKNDKFNFNNIIDLILREINQWTDNELNLIKYDIDSKNQYSIVSLKSTDSIESSLPTLKLYGKGSIVEQVDIDTIISNEISSQVAIMMNGSTNYEIEAQSISLLKFNNGIRSRLKSGNAMGEGAATFTNKVKTLLNVIASNHQEIHRFVSNPDKDDQARVDSYISDTLSVYRKFKQKFIDANIQFNNLDGLEGTPLFPIKIRVILPGISGIVIGNKLKIEDVRLPDIYTRNDVYYVVTSQQSKIENRYWQTLLELSPQINTADIKLRRQKSIEAQQSNLDNVEVDLNYTALLSAIKNQESRGYKWSNSGRSPYTSNNAPGININIPLLSGAEPKGDGKNYEPGEADYLKARGPYQMKPDALFDAYEFGEGILLSGNIRVNKEHILNNVVRPRIFNEIGFGDAKYSWKDTTTFNQIIDTPLLASRAVERYIKRYLNSRDVPIKKRTYLRALAIYKIGSGARLDNVFIARINQSDNKKYLQDARTYLINIEKIPEDNLRDPFIEQYIGPP